MTRFSPRSRTRNSPSLRSYKLQNARASIAMKRILRAADFAKSRSHGDFPSRHRNCKAAAT